MLPSSLKHSIHNNKTCSKFYVYGLIDPITNIIFYVGKGCGYRYKTHMYSQYLQDNNLKVNKIKSLLSKGLVYNVTIFAKDLYEHESYILETRLILLHGKLHDGTGVLTNMTDGGEGMGSYTYERTVEHNKFMSNNHKRLNVSVGKNNPMYGVSRPDASARMKNYHKRTNTSGKNNSNAKIFLVYDAMDNLVHTIHGNFIEYCTAHNLPRNALYESYYLHNSRPIYSTNRINKKFEQYKGWYMCKKD